MVRLVRRMVVRSAHEIAARAPLRLAVGERVTVGERDTQWREFVFVTCAHGEGWVPARHLSASSGEAIVRAGYDTTELPTQAGEVLEVVEEDRRSGWLWCRAVGGREGWVPATTLRSFDQ